MYPVVSSEGSKSFQANQYEIRFSLGYTFGSEMFSLEEPHGGSPYGPGTFAGADGSQEPRAYENQYAEHLGKYFGTVVSRFH